ncbi:hypothetical protein AAF712_006104 [Marasmius tenuissimus]|uniref:Uncharacterized protein n=1 Tax=Marasmius tenuissimus TaxID=585030 RepID=A0ABR3A1I7_9AGAR
MTSLKRLLCSLRSWLNHKAQLETNPAPLHPDLLNHNSSVPSLATNLVTEDAAGLLEAYTASASEADSDAGPSRPPRNRRRGGGQRQGGLPGLDEVDDTGKQVSNTAKGAVDTVGNTVGGLVGSKAEGDDEGGGSGDKPLKLRLDLNLDVVVELKAKVHGDLTLSLL